MAAPSSVVLLGHSYLAEENRKQLDALGAYCKVDVLSPSSWHEGMTHYDFQPGIVEGKNWCIHFLKERRLPGLPQSQYLFPGLGKKVKTLRPRLIHVESDPWTTFAMQMIHARNRFDRSIPLICTVKQNTYTSRGGLKDLLKQKMAIWGIRNTARFIGVSPSVQDLYHQQFALNPSRFDFNTHLGVDTEIFCPVDSNAAGIVRQKWLNEEAERALVIGYCGRLEKYKGVTDLVAAVELVWQRTGREIHLLVLGSGSLHDVLMAKAEACTWFHLFERVPHAQVAGFMQALDLFVMPARRTRLHEEHDGHAVIEALSCGLPCIGSDSGVLPGLLQDVGWVVPAGSEEQLAKRIERFSEGMNSDRQALRNSAGRQKVMGKFSLQAVAESNWRTYQKAMEQWNEAA